MGTLKDIKYGFTILALLKIINKNRKHFLSAILFVALSRTQAQDAVSTSKDKLKINLKLELGGGTAISFELRN